MSPRQTQLFATMLPIAQALQAKNGEFFPIAAQVNTTGELTHLMAGEEGREWSPSSTLLQILRDNLSQKAHRREILASALVYDTRVRLGGKSETTDAIVLELEDSADSAKIVFVPYVRSGAKFKYYPARVERGTESIFKSTPSTSSGDTILN